MQCLLWTIVAPWNGLFVGEGGAEFGVEIPGEEAGKRN